MSQHDYVIDNQTFPATRTDINNALAAIVTTNAGATAPSTTYAYQLWYDTTNDILKMRNSDNDAWIDLFNVNQTTDVATPSEGGFDVNGAELILDVDGDTSITADTDDQIDIKVGGTDEYSFTGTAFNIKGNDLILDADGDSKIEASTDDTINIISNSITGLTVDSSGRVLQPTKPMFSAYRNSTGVEGLTGYIVFDATRSNVGSHYSTSTGRFTAPVAGNYQFNFVGFGVNDTSGNYLAAGTGLAVELVNYTAGSGLAKTYTIVNSSTSYPNMSFSTTVPLSANDEVAILVGGKYVYSDTSLVYLNFSGYLIG
jgi:hypothetical protein